MASGCDANGGQLWGKLSSAAPDRPRDDGSRISTSVSAWAGRWTSPFGDAEARSWSW